MTQPDDEQISVDTDLRDQILEQQAIERRDHAFAYYRRFQDVLKLEAINRAGSLEGAAPVTTFLNEFPDFSYFYVDAHFKRLAEEKDLLEGKEVGTTQYSADFFASHRMPIGSLVNAKPDDDTLDFRNEHWNVIQTLGLGESFASDKWNNLLESAIEISRLTTNGEVDYDLEWLVAHVMVTNEDEIANKFSDGESGASICLDFLRRYPELPQILRNINKDQLTSAQILNLLFNPKCIDLMVASSNQRLFNQDTDRDKILAVVVNNLVGEDSDNTDRTARRILSARFDNRELATIRDVYATKLFEKATLIGQDEQDLVTVPSSENVGRILDIVARRPEFLNTIKKYLAPPVTLTDDLTVDLLTNDNVLGLLEQDPPIDDVDILRIVKADHSIQERIIDSSKFNPDSGSYQILKLAVETDSMAIGESNTIIRFLREFSPNQIDIFTTLRNRMRHVLNEDISSDDVMVLLKHPRAQALMKLMIFAPDDVKDNLAGSNFINICDLLTNAREIPIQDPLIGIRFNLNDGPIAYDFSRFQHLAIATTVDKLLPMLIGERRDEIETSGNISLNLLNTQLKFLAKYPGIIDKLKIELERRKGDNVTPGDVFRKLIEPKWAIVMKAAVFQCRRDTSRDHYIDPAIKLGDEATLIETIAKGIAIGIQPPSTTQLLDRIWFLLADGKQILDDTKHRPKDDLLYQEQFDSKIRDFRARVEQAA